MNFFFFLLYKCSGIFFTTVLWSWNKVNHGIKYAILQYMLLNIVLLFYKTCGWFCPLNIIEYFSRCSDDFKLVHFVFKAFLFVCPRPQWEALEAVIGQINEPFHVTVQYSSNEVGFLAIDSLELKDCVMGNGLLIILKYYVLYVLLASIEHFNCITMKLKLFNLPILIFDITLFKWMH